MTENRVEVLEVKITGTTLNSATPMTFNSINRETKRKKEKEVLRKFSTFEDRILIIQKRKNLTCKKTRKQLVKIIDSFLQ